MIRMCLGTIPLYLLLTISKYHPKLHMKKGTTANSPPPPFLPSLHAPHHCCIGHRCWGYMRLKAPSPSGKHICQWGLHVACSLITLR